MNQTACPYCGESISDEDEAVTLWDDRQYCRRCVEEVSPDLYQYATGGGQLVDVVEKSDVSLKNYVRGAGYKTLVVAFLIFMSPVVVLAVLDPVNARFDLAFGFCFFWCGFLAGYLILKGLLLLERSYLPRRVAVEHNRLVITTSDKDTSYPLDECQWALKESYRDGLTAYTGLRKGILFSIPERYICVGHDPALLPHLGAFLLLAGVRRKSYWSGLRIFILTVLGMLIGFLLGYCLGQIVALLTKDQFWLIALGFLGTFDGGAIAFNYAYYISFGRTATHQRMSPLIWGGMFFVLGVKVFLVRGGWMVLLGSGVNAALGIFAAWSIRCYINRADDRESIREHKRREFQEAFSHET
tara:strand:+ start:49714 stop:50781 length:1068 start_codon:yes stop_codon:yes gene_type:complete